MAIRNYNKVINIKDVTTGDIVTSIDFRDFDFGKLNQNSNCLGFMDLKIGHLYLLQEIINILNDGHDVYIFTGYKDDN